MKELTHDEFNSLSDGPHDRWVDGMPPEGQRVLVLGRHGHWMLWTSRDGHWAGDQGLFSGPALFPTWHKLPEQIIKES